MSTTDAFLPFDEPDDGDCRPDQDEDELDIEEGYAEQGGEGHDDGAGDETADEFADVPTAFRPPTPGARLSADELESELDDDA